MLFQISVNHSETTATTIYVRLLMVNKPANSLFLFFFICFFLGFFFFFFSQPEAITITIYCVVPYRNTMCRTDFKQRLVEWWPQLSIWLMHIFAPLLCFATGKKTNVLLVVIGGWSFFARDNWRALPGKEFALLSRFRAQSALIAFQQPPPSDLHFRFLLFFVQKPPPIRHLDG